MLQIIGLIITIAVIVWLSLQKKERAAASVVMQRPIKEHFATFRSAAIYLIAICGLILGLTGLIPFLLLGEPMEGFVLLLHVAISPIFILAVVIATLNWAHAHRFNTDNWLTVKACVSRKRAMPQDGGYRLWQNIFFWVIVLATTMLGSIVLSMYPLFGTVGMAFFLTLHKIAALLFLIAGAGFIFTTAHNQLLREPEKA